MERDRKSIEKYRTLQMSFSFQVRSINLFFHRVQRKSNLAHFSQMLEVLWEGCGHNIYWNQKKSSWILQQQLGLSLRPNLLSSAEPDGRIHLPIAPERRPCWPCLRRQFCRAVEKKIKCLVVLFCVLLLLCLPWFSEVYMMWHYYIKHECSSLQAFSAFLPITFAFSSFLMDILLRCSCALLPLFRNSASFHF